ncbi:MAG: HDOD domain-containing protein [Janthinobacterium lividum]
MSDRQERLGTYTIKDFAAAAAFPALSFVDPLPRIPAMAATTLQLEFLLQESLVDLKAISKVILSDAGATLQIFRLVGEEFTNDQDRPTRIEDCIASLNSECWYEAICQQGVSQNGRLVAEWQRCRRVGECARKLAFCLEGISPDEAYIVGLLHRIGEFPDLLGWSTLGGSSREHYALGVMLADFWQLPDYLSCAIQEQQTSSMPVMWRELLHMAKQLADPV